MSTARTVEVKRITLRAGNISTKGGEERERERERKRKREKEQEEQEKTDSQ